MADFVSSWHCQDDETHRDFLWSGYITREQRNAAAKNYLRSLLFSTSRRGRIIESMHVALSRNETHQNFNIWVHGDEKLVRGSGLFVGESGVAAGGFGKFHPLQCFLKVSFCNPTLALTGMGTFFSALLSDMPMDKYRGLLAELALHCERTHRI